ncbi:MAG: hypothetical protein ACLU0O_12630 [Collinsella sp.]
MRFFIYGDDACYGYVASQHFPAAVVADVVLKRARAVSNWDIAGGRQLNSTSDTNRYHHAQPRLLARYMQIWRLSSRAVPLGQRRDLLQRVHPLGCGRQVL